MHLRTPQQPYLPTETELSRPLEPKQYSDLFCSVSNVSEDAETGLQLVRTAKYLNAEEERDRVLTAHAEHSNVRGVISVNIPVARKHKRQKPSCETDVNVDTDATCSWHGGQLTFRPRQQAPLVATSSKPFEAPNGLKVKPSSC